jgi:hypothetical protein
MTKQQKKAVELVKMIFTNVNQLHTMKHTRSFNHLQFKMIDDISKKIAINLVDETIKSFSQYSGMHDQEFFDSEAQYWQQVKTEINKL